MRNEYLRIWIVRVLFDKEEFGVLIGVKICFDTSSHYSVLTRDDHIRKQSFGSLRAPLTVLWCNSHPAHGARSYYKE